jgi:hypothetical protein
MTQRPEIRRANNKLNQARFHLAHLTLSARQDREVLLAVESFLGGCLGAVQAAFFTLEREAPDFKVVHGQWKTTLSQAEREFVNRMMSERSSDVHAGNTTLHLNLTITPGSPETSEEFRFKGYGGAVEISAACQRFIDLIQVLVDRFEQPTGSDE